MYGYHSIVSKKEDWNLGTTAFEEWVNSYLMPQTKRFLFLRWKFLISVQVEHCCSNANKWASQWRDEIKYCFKIGCIFAVKFDTVDFFLACWLQKATRWLYFLKSFLSLCKWNLYIQYISLIFEDIFTLCSNS